MINVKENSADKMLIVMEDPKVHIWNIVSLLKTGHCATKIRHEVSINNPKKQRK